MSFFNSHDHCHTMYLAASTNGRGAMTPCRHVMPLLGQLLIAFVLFATLLGGPFFVLVVPVMK